MSNYFSSLYHNIELIFLFQMWRSSLGGKLVSGFSWKCSNTKPIFPHASSCAWVLFQEWWEFSTLFSSHHPLHPQQRCFAPVFSIYITMLDIEVCVRVFVGKVLPRIILYRVGETIIIYMRTESGRGLYFCIVIICTASYRCFWHHYNTKSIESKI